MERLLGTTRAAVLNQHVAQVLGPGEGAAFAQRLVVWLDEVLRRFAPRILPVEITIARRWGRLAAAHGHGGADLLTAATALEHGLTVATSNTRHFLNTGVALIDPLAPK